MGTGNAAVPRHELSYCTINVKSHVHSMYIVSFEAFTAVIFLVEIFWIV